MSEDLAKNSINHEEAMEEEDLVRFGFDPICTFLAIRFVRNWRPLKAE
jgi:hypothetical protein